MTEIINFPVNNQGATGVTGPDGVEGIDGIVATPEAPVKKTVKFRGQEVKLHYTLLSMQRLEETGVSLKDLETFGEEVSITSLGKILWAGLCVQFNDATIEEVLNSFELSDLQEVSEAMSAALSAAGK